MTNEYPSIELRRTHEGVGSDMVAVDGAVK